MTRVAAIDLGTNTALMVVGERAPDGTLRVLDDACVTVRLGEGLARRGTPAPAAVERALACLADFRARALALGVELANLRVASTAVLRRATDADEFRRLTRERTGLAVDVLSGEDEARLAHRAAVSDQGGSAETVVVDVGGGSTEVVADAGRLRLSVEVGAVVLTEAYLAPDPPQAGGWSALVAFVERELRALPRDVARGRTVVALGGTAVNLASLVLGLARFDPVAAEGVEVTALDARRWAETLAGLPVAERTRRPIEADRAEILPAGLACVAAALSRLGAEVARVSGRGLRYGLLLEALDALDAPG